MRVAAVDIGSNSVRLLVLDDTGGPLVRRTIVTGLGRGLEATGRMSEDAIVATIDAIAEFSIDMRSVGVDRCAAVATSASRDARNGADVMARIGDALGTVPEIISGDREASLSFSGATAELDVVGTAVVVDIGGGSTEVVAGAPGSGPRWGHSYDIGSVRLTDRCLPDRPAPREQLVGAAREVDRILSSSPLMERIDQPIGVAGTFTSLAAMHLRLPGYDPDLVHGTVLGLDDVRSLLERLGSLSVAETAAIPSLEPKRAPVILAGTVIAERLLVALGADRVLVSERDLLDGLAATLLA
jgi:exopolyphosphatase / guanosine-5'-triphosphate,3'-diphosphate pyrophosphatase